MAVLVLINFPKRKQFLYSYMQYGIDCHHISLKNGGAWRAYGGFGNGRKWPIVFAGILLDDARMQHPPKTCKTTFAPPPRAARHSDHGAGRQ